jgi:hypothetical protein
MSRLRERRFMVLFVRSETRDFCSMPVTQWLRATAALGFGLASATNAPFSHAQTLEDLDRLVVASQKPVDGLALARSQADSGALLEALASLERVLAADPKNKSARLLHASMLCRVDDPDGAAVEFSQLKPRDYKKAEWAAAIAPCNTPAEERR